MAKRRTKDKPSDRPARALTMFLPDYPDQVKAIAMQGLTDREMAIQFGVTPRLMAAWKKRYPEFREAIERGRTMADVAVVQALHKKAIGYTVKEVKLAQHEGEFTDERVINKEFGPDLAAIKMWLTNRQPDQWADRTEHSIGNKKGETLVFEGAPKDETKAELVSSILALIEPKGDNPSGE